MRITVKTLILVKNVQTPPINIAMHYTYSAGDIIRQFGNWFCPENQEKGLWSHFRNFFIADQHVIYHTLDHVIASLKYVDTP